MDKSNLFLGRGTDEKRSVGFFGMSRLEASIIRRTVKEFRIKSWIRPEMCNRLENLAIAITIVKIRIGDNYSFFAD